MNVTKYARVVLLNDGRNGIRKPENVILCCFSIYRFTGSQLHTNFRWYETKWLTFNEQNFLHDDHSQPFYSPDRPKWLKHATKHVILLPVTADHHLLLGKNLKKKKPSAVLSTVQRPVFQHRFPAMLRAESIKSLSWPNWTSQFTSMSIRANQAFYTGLSDNIYFLSHWRFTCAVIKR